MARSSSEIANSPNGFRGKSSWRPLGFAVGCLCGGLIAFKLLSYRSSEPWIFGLYSLPYFVFLLCSIVGTGFVVYIFTRFRVKAFYILIAWAIVPLLCLGFLELGGQIYAFVHPAYRVLSFEPDRAVGWKLVPNLRYTWGGQYWYANEFSVPIAINSHGYRDAERAVNKPEGVTRVALLGDSMIEAMQVPLEQTSGRVLEQKLNFAPLEGKTARYEVLNFGVSNYGIGQYLLNWEQYASKYKPDYVFILVGEIHMDRTVTKYESSAVSASERRLWVRPTFRIVEGKLLREPAQDYDEFVQAQRELIEQEFAGKRAVRRSHGFFIGPFLDVSLWQRLMEVQRRFAGQAKHSEAPAEAYQTLNESAVAVNLKIIEELGRQVAESGGQLVVVDASRYFRFLKWQGLTPILKQFCAEHRLGWIPLGDQLLDAEKNGVVTRWAHDQHFNQTGNSMFAEAMYRWLSNHVGTRKDTVAPVIGNS